MGGRGAGGAWGANVEGGGYVRDGGDTGRLSSRSLLPRRSVRCAGGYLFVADLLRYSYL